MYAVLGQQQPSDGATRLVLVIVLAGFVLVLIEAAWSHRNGRRDDD